MCTCSVHGQRTAAAHTVCEQETLVCALRAVRQTAFAFSLNFLGYIPTGDGLLCINGQDTKIVLASENHPKKTSEMTRKNVRDESARGARRGSKNVAEEREGNVKRRRPKGTGP